MKCKSEIWIWNIWMAPLSSVCALVQEVALCLPPARWLQPGLILKDRLTCCWKPPITTSISHRATPATMATSTTTSNTRWPTKKHLSGYEQQTLILRTYICHIITNKPGSLIRRLMFAEVVDVGCETLWDNKVLLKPALHLKEKTFWSLNT